jgi:2',3'-cyclic-nucleotide 2'-phosphodiesterase/3'-nucleotidase
VILLSVVSLQAQTVNLKIIETSDLHGALYPYDFRDDKPVSSSLAQVSTYVKEQRAKTDQELLLLDNGDNLQGQPVVYYYNFEKTNVHHLLSDMFNYLKYDAASVGNHDIEAGHAVYDRMVTEFNFPLMAANAVKPDGTPYFQPYKIFEKKGIKIAVLGLITPAIPNWLPRQIWSGMEFEDMIAAANKWVKIIKEKEKPDVIVGLFHSGVEFNYNGQTADQEKNENASELVAEQVAGFDVIFTGHDHKIWNKTVKNPEGKDVLLAGPNSEARTVAEADFVLSFNKDENKWEKNVTGNIIQMSNYKADDEFIKKFEPEFNEVKQYVAKEVGEFTETVSTRDAMFGESKFIDLIHQIQLEISKADISFAAPLSFDAKIEKGKIFVRDMFNLYKFENYLYTMQLTGREVKGALEYSFSNWFDVMKDENGHLINFKKNKNGQLLSSGKKAYEAAVQYFNYESAAGINYTVDVSKPYGKRVNITSMANGEKFDLDKKYRVAVNSYRGNGGGGHLIKGAGINKEDLPGRILNSTDKDLRFYMMKWIEEKKTVTPVLLGNWKIIPEEWSEKGKNLDYNIMYKKKK